jgi:hypothetical protein
MVSQAALKSMKRWNVLTPYSSVFLEVASPIVSVLLLIYLLGSHIDSYLPSSPHMVIGCWYKILENILYPVFNSVIPL